MALYLEQRFPLGRFHATRWRTNPFEDPYGEWPPSPWRLLRALAARWFEYAREFAAENTDPIRDRLLGSISGQPPQFYLPPKSLRGLPIKQYQPIGVDWTDKGAGKPGYKKAGTTLAVDHYRAIDPDDCIYWIWPDLELNDEEEALLDALLARMHYFGRAESYCEMRRLDCLPRGTTANTHLYVGPSKERVPVLVANSANPPTISTILAATDNPLVRNRTEPEGTCRMYAELPALPQPRPRPNVTRYPQGVNLLQFAVGGYVFPPQSSWVKVAERFRGATIRELIRILTGSISATYQGLSIEQKEGICLITGKNGFGMPMQGHDHVYIMVIPDEANQPTRLVAWRRTPFESEEISAFLAASNNPLSWESRGVADWTLRIVPLPFDTALPSPLSSNEATTWESLTLFVPPRFHLRRNGKPRSGESVEEQARRLLIEQGLPEPNDIVLIDKGDALFWVTVHQPLTERIERRHNQGGRRGFRLRITFPHPVKGPILIGHSCHFGLGQLQPRDH